MTFPAELRVIFSEDTVESVIIAIAGIGTPPPERWNDDAKSSWLECIPPTAAPKKAILKWDHGLDVDNISWQRLVEQGRDLLNTLIDLQSPESGSQWRNRPIIFICHSLGGLILKQTLSLAHSQTHACRSLLSVVAGVIFLGTPHIRDEAKESWGNCLLILRSVAKTGTKANVTNNDSKFLAGVCRRFDQIRIQTPIQSIIESRETRVQKAFSSRKLVLVPSELATTDAPNETTFQVDTKHVGLCNIRKSSQLHKKVLDFIGSAIEDIARTTNEQATLVGTFEEFDLRNSSPGSVSNPIRGHDSQGPSRAEATDNSTGASYKLISRNSTNSIPTISDFTSRKAIPKLPCRFNLPPRNQSFFGREDILSSLEAVLLPKVSGRDSPYEPQHLKTFVLCGIGGMGKTQIVAEFALSNLVSYDAVFWLHADEAAKLYDGFTKISIELGLEEASQAKDQVISRDLVKGWLANPVKQVFESLEELQEASWLMIFDNADDPETISDFWPVDGNGSVLATSRNPVFPITRGHDLGPLKTEDAAAWLLKSVHRVHEHDRQAAAVKAARRLDGIPLAIIQMAAYMNQCCLSFAKFLEVYEEEEKRFLHGASDTQGCRILAADMTTNMIRSPTGGTLHLERKPRDYALRVSEHANQSSQTSLFPGQNYENLADYLWRPYGNERPHPTSSDGPTPTAGLDCFATIHILHPKGSRVIHLEKVDEFLGHREESGAHQKENCLLFLRGFASPDWLNAVGSSYWVDPEFFQRHLEFFSTIGKRNYFPLPSIVSSTSNIIRLRITTMGHRDSSAETHNQTRLDALRDLCAKDMDNYLERIKLEGIEPGDSVVRRFSVHNNTQFSLEQDITFCITHCGQGWTVIAWLDPGNPLSEELNQADIPRIPQRRWSPLTRSSDTRPTSRQVPLASVGRKEREGTAGKIYTTGKAQGPWQREAFSPYELAAELHPIIQHHPGMALNSSKFALRGQGHLAQTRGFHQSATLLHLGYGRTLDEETLASDAFYALHEFFTFKAFSESQFLNVVEAAIAPETSHMVLLQEQPTLSNLLYHKEILLNHAQELRSVIPAIKNRGSDQWPRALSEGQQRIACEAADTLLHDFESLLQRTELLSRRCDQDVQSRRLGWSDDLPC